MLLRLDIRDFVIVDRLELEFRPYSRQENTGRLRIERRENGGRAVILNRRGFRGRPGHGIGDVRFDPKDK